jgi:hypothetical protein
MSQFIEITLVSGDSRVLNTSQIAEVSEHPGDNTAIFHMVSGTPHPSMVNYATVKQLLTAGKTAH